MTLAFGGKLYCFSTFLNSCFFFFKVIFFHYVQCSGCWHSTSVICFTTKANNGHICLSNVNEIRSINTVDSLHQVNVSVLQRNLIVNKIHVDKRIQKKWMLNERKLQHNSRRTIPFHLFLLII